VLFDVIGAGQGNFALTGSATVPGGGAAQLLFTPASVSAR